MICTFLLLVCVCLCGGVKTDEVKSVSVMEGDSVTLNPDLQIQRDEETVWRFNSVRIAKVTEDHPTYEDERFRDRLKLDQTGSLTITNTRTTDSGLYQLDTVINNKELMKKFNVTVYAKPSITMTITLQNPSSSKSTSEAEQVPHRPPGSPEVSLPVMASISAAAAGSLLIMAGIGMFCICRKHRDEVNTDEYENPQSLHKHTGHMMKSEMTEVVYTRFVTEQRSNSL